MLYILVIILNKKEDKIEEKTKEKELLKREDGKNYSFK